MECLMVVICFEVDYLCTYANEVAKLHYYCSYRYIPNDQWLYLYDNILWDLYSSVDSIHLQNQYDFFIYCIVYLQFLLIFPTELLF